MKLSARNILKGKIVDVIKGQTTAHVRISNCALSPTEVQQLYHLGTVILKGN